MGNWALSLLLTAFVATPLPASTAAPSDEPPVPQDRSVDPVVLTGAQFPSWSAGGDITLREPQLPVNYDTADPVLDQSDCANSDPQEPTYRGDHSCYQSSRVPNNPATGADISRLLGYRWTGETFEQIPFQVDERAVRYISNNASGFAFYSGVDQHVAYVYDDERFRWTDNPPDDPSTVQDERCLSLPRNGQRSTPDPIRGLDDNDELAFMWRDAGAQAPTNAALPASVESAYEVRVDDPSAPGSVAYVYVMLAAPGGPVPAFTAENSPYVRYARDPDADIFLYSQSSYDGYGNAPKGVYCNEDGTRRTDQGPIAQRRPKDRAWIYTSRYAFRYEGRWLMTELRVAPSDLTAPITDPDSYGLDLIDQWKARAFQQRPGGETPCCGYEEEVNNWGGSSILMGERAGPVRVIRDTWGADSSTNNVREEVFYAFQIRFADYLRVHPIPPADGIYAQWDYNATAVERYYNPNLPGGVPVDGRNDESLGNMYVHAAPDKIEVRDDDPVPVTGPVGASIPLGGEYDDCRILGERGFCNDVDQPDPFFSGPAASLNWEQVSGPHGGWVTRWGIRQFTAGGTPQSLIASPYYRDDSCFDDGTGSNPGPHLRSRDVDDPLDPATGQPRTCWMPGDPLFGDVRDQRYFQGSIGTHGVHLQIIAESDNASLTVPLTEIDSEQRAVVLTGSPENVGERYGHDSEFPLRTTATPRT